jgi:hypothetical protein
MDISELNNSRFLSKADVIKEPLVGTIAYVTEKQNVAPAGQPPSMQYVLVCEERGWRPVSGREDTVKPYPLRKTNGNLIAAMFGKTNSEDWEGKQVEFYWNPEIQFKGEITGGIRIRKPAPVNSTRKPEYADCPY